ncbi:cytosine permease [Microbacterium karelineae]|uniref:cytosine permease n=1 Tax=Microbacterium karelineae TaxID=2654283 RepID=UPI0012E9A25E|nr:cytosine permease [Microbacterium karelineae]
MSTTARPGATSARPADRIDHDYPLTPVPPGARRGTASIVVLIAGFLFFTPTMLTAAQVAVEFPFAQFIGLAAVAAVVLAVYIALMGAVSARTGLTTVMVARTVLGKGGGKWASLLLGGTQIGWYGVTVGTLVNLMSRAFGWEITWPIAMIGGVLMAISAYAGVKGIEILSWIAVPLMLILCVWVLALALDETGGWGGLMQTEGLGTLSAGAAVTIMISTFISGGTQIGNWTRFARAGRIALIATFASVIIVQFTMLFFGGVGAAAFGEGDFAELLVSLGLIGPAMILLIANLWTTNDNTAYAYGVAGSELFDKPDRRPFVVAGTIVGIALAVFGFDGLIVPFLSALGVLIPPLGGAVIGMFFLSWRGRGPQLTGSEPMFRGSGIAAYLVGVAVAWGTTYMDLGSPAIQGIIAAALVAPVAYAIELRAARRGTPAS